jgi:hypothetical protein
MVTFRELTFGVFWGLKVLGPKAVLKSFPWYFFQLQAVHPQLFLPQPPHLLHWVLFCFVVVLWFEFKALCLLGLLGGHSTSPALSFLRNLSQSSTEAGLALHSSHCHFHDWLSSTLQVRFVLLHPTAPLPPSVATHITGPGLGWTDFKNQSVIA